MDDATAFLHASMPLCATLGVRAGEATPEQVVLNLDYAPELRTAGELLHGGAIMALADSSGALCAFLNLPEGATGTATIESKTNFFGAVTAGTISAMSSLLHAGRTTIVVETEVRHDDRLVAKVTQTQAVLGTKD